MKLTSTSFEDGQPLPGRCAFAVMHPEQHVELTENRNPQLAWSEVPEGTRSFALLCIDADAPCVGDDVNKEGRTVPKELPRADFVHWAMVDLPADCREIAEGACSQGVTAGGKEAPAGPSGARQGLNDYTGWFAGDDDMGGAYRGYDGPCPPWNDERPHRYRFEILALDLDRCAVEGDFTAAEVRTAIEGHVLASASLTGIYTLNPDVKLD